MCLIELPSISISSERGMNYKKEDSSVDDRRKKENPSNKAK